MTQRAFSSQKPSLCWAAQEAVPEWIDLAKLNRPHILRRPGRQLLPGLLNHPKLS